MVNSALKITAFMIVLSGLISAFSVALSMAGINGLMPTSTSTYNLNQQQWYNITADTTTISDNTPSTSNINGYSNGVSAVTDFLMGTVYLKGTIDSFCMNNPVVGLFTTVMQTLIYFIAIIGALGWVLNKFNII